MFHRSIYEEGCLLPQILRFIFPDGRQAYSEADSQLLGPASSCERAEAVLMDKRCTFLIKALLSSRK